MTTSLAQSAASLLAGEVAILKQPKAICAELRLGADGRLELLLQRTWVAVNPVRCFPWSEAMRFISLRSKTNEELALVAHPRELDPDSRWALFEALQVAGFVLEVTSVVSVKEDFEIRAWKVRTQRGVRSFQTELDSWPHPSPAGGHLIQDVGGDVFLIPPLVTLDPESRRLLWPYVD